MNTMQLKKSQTTQNEVTQALWTELSDDQSTQLAGGRVILSPILLSLKEISDYLQSGDSSPGVA